MSWRRRPAAIVVLVAAMIAITVSACSSVSTVRVQSDNLYVGPRMRPIAIVHAQVSSAYVLFIPIPGRVSLDRVVNRMLLAAAKSLGADKVVNIQVDITPDGGIWTLRKLLGWRSATASGVAVVVEDVAAPAVEDAAVAPGLAPGLAP